MIGEEAVGQKEVRVRFSFPNELNAKLVQVIVNRYAPLINYKRQLQNTSRIDLYGKRMTFKYTHSNSDQYIIEYLQELANKGSIELKHHMEVQVFFEEMGG